MGRVNRLCQENWVEDDSRFQSLSFISVPAAVLQGSSGFVHFKRSA